MLIAKALAHEPRILFVDELTAGVDVKLRHDMWQKLRALFCDVVTSSPTSIVDAGRSLVAWNFPRRLASITPS